MFSLDRFYNILHNNLISRFVNGRSVFFYPFGTYQQTSILDNHFDVLAKPFGPEKYWPAEQTFFHTYFFDQEPLYDYTLPIVRNAILNRKHFSKPSRIHILANSEKSEIKNQCVKQYDMYDWYYFFHGFAALDWYRDFQYANPTAFNQFDKVFICYNHLISKYRSYRLHLVSNMIEQDLIKHGKVSLFLCDTNGTWKDTIEDSDIPLDNRARVKIYHALKNLTQPLTIDTTSPSGSLSANVCLDDLTSALFHIVTETVYFQNKLHLTEKVFKPIVAKRPFILVAAPGNLAYLKSYGFKTFDRWIDESYDNETDHYIRIEKITAEINRLCNLSSEQLVRLHREMQEILQHNFDHFYTTFKYTIVDELVDNFKNVLDQINQERTKENHGKFYQQFELPKDYLEEVKKRLKQ